LELFAMRIAFLSSLLMLVLTGCYVPNRSYRVDHSLIQVPELQKLPAKKPQPDGPACTAQSLTVRPCLAFLEFDDMGERWSQDSQPVTADENISNTSELSNAIKIIHAAVRQDPGAVIITFTHGWKHNAKEGDSNIEGFKQVLNDLHDNRYRNHIVVGIFISWRGELVSPYMPVRRNFTYFNREAAAIRIPGASLTDALIRIAAAAHSAKPDANDERPLVVFVGHSFGGLVMERALTQATIHQVDQADQGDDAQKINTYHPLADLVVFVNSAAAATEAKETLDLFASNHFRYGIAGEPERPLFLSVSSSADLATRFAMPVGHGLPYLGYKIHGGLRDKDPLACYNPRPGDSMKGQSFFIIPAPSQGAFYMSTAAHMPILQSHEVVEENDPAKRKECALSNYAGTPTPTLFTYALPDSGRCFRVQEKANRCNGTPYWMMEIDPSIVPDHGTIFTDRFIAFLSKFLPSKTELESNIRPTLSAAQ
jgi:hypothetical protein